MNNKTILAIAFLLAGTLLTGTTAMAPAYAGGDDDDDHKGGDGNKQKVEEDSAGAIADCDKNDVEESDFDCIAAAATDDSEIGTGDGDNGDGDNGDNGELVTICHVSASGNEIEMTLPENAANAHLEQHDGPPGSGPDYEGECDGRSL
jgi:hypothetical protein